MLAPKNPAGEPRQETVSPSLVQSAMAHRCAAAHRITPLSNFRRVLAFRLAGQCCEINQPVACIADGTVAHSTGKIMKEMLAILRRTSVAPWSIFRTEGWQAIARLALPQHLADN